MVSLQMSQSRFLDEPFTAYNVSTRISFDDVAGFLPVSRFYFLSESFQAPLSHGMKGVELNNGLLSDQSHRT